MKFDLESKQEQVIALAQAIADNAALLKQVESGITTLKPGDKVTLIAGLPIVKTGEIGGESRTWLAFPAKVDREGRSFTISLSLNSLKRGYYATEKSEVLRHSETTGKDYPSPELKMRFGAFSVLETSQNGITVPYVAADQTVTMIQIKGYRPIFESETWTVKDEGDLIVAQ